MSNFETIGIVSNAITGTAVSIYTASTKNSFSQLVAAGYLNDIAKAYGLKANDRFYINYADQSVQPVYTGESAIYGGFKVQYDPTLQNWNLLPDSIPSSVVAAMGLYSNTANYAGGAASFTVNDSNINPNSVVIARWQSSANAVGIYTVAPASGSMVVTSNSNPGAGVLEFISVLPSVALQNAGIYAANYSYAGGASSFVINNPNVVAGMVVTANFVSQANAAFVYSAVAGNGTITVTCSANPGASVLAYMAVSPSSALASSGFYAASYINAGGSATTTVTDGNVTVNSIVVASWASQANAAYIEKVTPGAGSLTVLSSADPGASVLNYMFTPSVAGSLSNQFLPLSGGQLSGSVLTTKGTGTISAGAVTINAQSGVITGTFSTAAAGTTSVTFNNSLIKSNSVILVSLMGGTNAIPGVQLSCAYSSAGVATLVVTNNNVAGSALSGTLLIGFVVL